MTTNRWRFFLVFSLSLILIFLTACSSIDCPVQNVVRTVYTLQKGDMTADTLKGDTLTVFTRRRDGTDTLLLSRITGVSTFALPMGFSNPEDTLYFYQKLDSTATLDTVWIKKENYPHFESVDCSASFFHTVTDVRHTHYGLDSIVINKSSVDYDAKTEHFHLYLKARR